MLSSFTVCPGQRPPSTAPPFEGRQGCFNLPPQQLFLLPCLFAGFGGGVPLDLGFPLSLGLTYPITEPSKNPGKSSVKKEIKIRMVSHFIKPNA